MEQNRNNWRVWQDASVRLGSLDNAGRDFRPKRRFFGTKLTGGQIRPEPNFRIKRNERQQRAFLLPVLRPVPSSFFTKNRPSLRTKKEYDHRPVVFRLPEANLALTNGGGSGIRTLGGLSPSSVFKTGAFDHSAKPPQPDPPNVPKSIRQMGKCIHLRFIFQCPMRGEFCRSGTGGLFRWGHAG